MRAYYSSHTNWMPHTLNTPYTLPNTQVADWGVG